MKLTYVRWMLLGAMLGCGPRLPEATQYGILPDIVEQPITWQVDGVFPADGAQITEANFVAVRLLGQAESVTVQLHMTSAGMDVDCPRDTEVSTTVEVTRTYTRYLCPIGDFLLLDGWNDFEVIVLDAQRSESYLRSFYYNAQPVALTAVWDGASQLQWATEARIKVYLRINQVRLALGTGSGQATLDTGLLPTAGTLQIEAWRHDGKHSEITLR